MKDKFCISKGLVYMMILVGAILATFLATNYANNGSLTLNSQAGFTCKQFDCGTIVAGSGGHFWAKNGKYYGDKNCNGSELTQGVGNFCRKDVTSTGQAICVKKTCASDSQRVYYQKKNANGTTTFFGDSSCTGSINLQSYCNIASTTPGTGSVVACLNYSCTTIDEEKGVGRNYSVKEGLFYASTGCNSDNQLKALVGIGKYCKGTYVKFSCYNWWAAFDIDKTTDKHLTLETDLNRSKAVYTNNNGYTWTSDDKGKVPLTGSVHDFCTSKK